MKNGNHHHGQAQSQAKNDGYVLITGGSGFVGANVADRILREGERVLLYDNLSRAGVEQNYEWLRSMHGDRVRLQNGDTRDATALAAAVEKATTVYHFAAQVAVTTSLSSPREDFAINALGTFNLLEALRMRKDPPPLFFSSTNKVYGKLGEIPLQVRGERYEPADPVIRERGVSERQMLDFYSPYGCSKGTADAYILDYARTYGLPAVVFRMSCIYGPRQFGTEDQGWVAHFFIRAIEGSPIVLYGDGRQVRDLLFVEDLVDAFLLARENITTISGRAFNIGGGPANAISLLELLELITEIEGQRPEVEMEEWRPGDQRFYVSDTARFREATGWRARVGVEEGTRRLHEWLRSKRSSLAVA